MIKIADKKDFNEITSLRKEVNDVHVNGEPKIFKSGFPLEMQNYLNEFFDNENKCVAIYVENDEILGYAMLEVRVKPETPYMYEQTYLNITELGVKDGLRGKGIGKQIMEYVIDYAKNKNLNRVELDVWCFNDKAVNFYKKLGFETYRNYLRLPL